MALTRLIIFLFILLFLVLEAEARTKLNYQKRLKLAQEHYRRVEHQITCGLPKPKIFIMSTPSMPLAPSATVLHRCGDQSECCSIPTQKCVAKDYTKVKLYFIVKSFPGASRRRRKIKRFVLTNHTSCHCSDETDSLL